MSYVADTEALFDEVQVNADITIYNKYTIGRDEKYRRAQVQDVCWQDSKASQTLAIGGQIEANQALVFIPFSRGDDYLAPKEWQSNPTGTAWTLQVGDVIVKGLVSNEITGSYGVGDLKRAYNQVLTITSVDAFDQNVIMNHWQVGAK